MTKLKLYLRNSAKCGLLLSLLLFFGCSSSTTPTYLKETADRAIEDICKKEYQIDIKAKLIGQTLWVYLPVKDMLSKSEKPDKYTERFNIETAQSKYDFDAFKVDYAIKPMPEKEKSQDYGFDKDISEKVNKIWRALRRLLLSMAHADKNGIRFFYVITADTKNGFETKSLIYAIDLKKVSYENISQTEFQHRAPQDTDMSMNIIGDEEGKHLEYKDISMGEFIALQIQHRIKLKFQKPEVERTANIDKEIEKIAIITAKIYNFNEFSQIELNNLVTNIKTNLNRATAFSKAVD